MLMVMQRQLKVCGGMQQNPLVATHWHEITRAKQSSINICFCFFDSGSEQSESEYFSKLIIFHTALSKKETNKKNKIRRT